MESCKYNPGVRGFLPCLIGWLPWVVVPFIGCGPAQVPKVEAERRGPLPQDSIAYFELIDSLDHATVEKDLAAEARITGKLIRSPYATSSFRSFMTVQNHRWQVMSMQLRDPHYTDELDSMFQESKAANDTMRMFVLLTQKVHVAFAWEKNTAKLVTLLEEALALDPKGTMRAMDHTLNYRYAEVCAALGQWRKALDASLRIYQYGVNEGMPDGQYWGLLYAAEAYWKLDLTDSCDLAIQKALVIMKGSDQAAADPYTYNLIAELYRKRGLYEKVEPMLDSTAAVLRREGLDYTGCGFCMVERVWWYLRKGQARAGLDLAETVTKNPRQQQPGVSREALYEVMDSAYRAVGDYRQAYAIRAEHDALARNRDLTTASANLSNMENAQQERTAEEGRRQAKQLAEAELRTAMFVRNGFIGGFAVVLLFAAVFFAQRNRITKEKRRSEELLLNILPAVVAEELKAKGQAEAVHIDQVTVLFTDFKGFTAMSEVVTPQQLVRDLNESFSAFDHITEKYGIEKIKTIGDAYMAAGGLPTPNTTHAADVIKAALEMRDFIAEGKVHKIAAGLPFFEVRIGVHTGPVVAGIVGVKKFQYDIWGDTVNTASRMESSGEVGQVNISEATYALVHEHAGRLFTFTPRGKVQAKGKGEMEMYFVESTIDDRG